MPRRGREKSPECMYHVMSRSISELNLYHLMRTKITILAFYSGIKKISLQYLIIHPYDTHVHIYINTCGADISSFMHSLILPMSDITIPNMRMGICLRQICKLHS